MSTPRRRFGCMGDLIGAVGFFLLWGVDEWRIPVGVGLVVIALAYMMEESA